jgi:signal transduction histidine kinase
MLSVAARRMSTWSKGTSMLQDFLTVNRAAILAKTRALVSVRRWPPASTLDAEYGVPLFLSQLSETLRSETSGAPAFDVIGPSAVHHGRELMALGFTLSQVVHNYGDVCQAITELALDQRAPITTREFHILNRCLDTAIAEAVTEHARITAESRVTEEIERLGHLAHELRDRLNTAVMAFDIVRRGTVSVNGSTGTVLGRSLIGLRDLVNTTLADVRMAANQHRRERLPVTSFLNDIAIAGSLHADDRGQRFAIDPIDPALAFDVDPQLLTSAVTNVLNNAFKYTPSGGGVVLRARKAGARVLIEIEDECGGIPENKADLFEAFGERHGMDRTGLGLGLAIARRAVRAHGGDIHVDNMPGKGCVFRIEVPLAVSGMPGRAASA